MQSGRALLLLCLCVTGADAAETFGPDARSEGITIHAPLWTGAYLAHSTCSKRFPHLRNNLATGLAAYRVELRKADAGVQKEVEERGTNGPPELGIYKATLEQRAERLDFMLSALNEETCEAVIRMWKAGNANMLIQSWKTIVGSDPVEAPAQ